ncbi:MAG TPA: DUF6719 family protein [Pseudolabrys sp.]|nr:DUF6719 family protein [Pseudolabrys sp.]
MRHFFLIACFTFSAFSADALSAFGANAQTRDCRAIADAGERLKCFDRPKDCKSIANSAERLKCFDAQTTAAPSAPAAPAAPPPPPEAPAFTAQILHVEPPIGQLPPGAKVLIDDGTCPPGKLKQVIGGNVTTGQARIRSCVARP